MSKFKYLDEVTGEHTEACFVLVEDDISEAEMESLETCLGDGFEVRAPHSGEAAGIYYYKSNGNLQLLGYSLSVPEEVDRHIREAWENHCNS